MPALDEDQPVLSPPEKQAEQPSGSKPRARRGVFFWLAISLLALILLPVLGYFALLAYVWAGGIKSRVENRISKMLDAPAKVRSVSTRWLGDLKISDISVGTGENELLKAGSVTLDWDAGPLLQEDRVRSVAIDRPKISLRRDATGHWNFSPKPAPKGAAYRLEQVLFDHGQLAISWNAAGGQQRGVELQALSGTYSDQGRDAPSPFSAYGVFDSLENMSLRGSLGPGAAWNARAQGGLNLERDLANVFGVSPNDGPRGHLRFDLSGRRESLMLDPARGGALALNGQIDLERFRWPLGTRFSLAADGATLDLRVKADLDVPPGSLATLEDVNVRLQGLGNLHGVGCILDSPGPCVSFTGVSGTLDAEALNKLFEPHLLPADISLRGSLAVSGLATTFPLGSGAPPGTIAAALATSGARISFSTLGELPAVDAAAYLNWPALKAGKLKIDDIAHAELSIENLNPRQGDFWVEFARGTVLKTLDVDIGRFWESDIGRRVLTMNFKRGEPIAPASELPWIMRGTLKGSDVRVSASPADGGCENVSLTALTLEDASLSKWPAPFQLPKQRFSGTLKLDACFKDGLVQSVTNRVTLTDEKWRASAAKDAPLATTPITLRFSQVYRPYAAPQERVGPVQVEDLTMPLQDVAEILGLKQTAGLTGAGILRITGATFDLSGATAAGTLALEGGTLDIALPASSQSLLLNAVRMAGYPMVAAALETFPVETLKLADVNARLKVAFANGRLNVSGQTQPARLKVEVPSGVPFFGGKGTDFQIREFPAAEIGFDIDLSAKEGSRSQLWKLAWGEGAGRLMLILNEQAPKTEAAREAGSSWMVSGSFESAELMKGLALKFEAPVNLRKQRIGNSSLSAKQIDLGAAGQRLGLAPGTMSGSLKNVELKLKPFSYASLSLEKIGNGSIEADLENVAFSQPGAEVAQLTGHLRSVIGAAASSISVNTLLKLSSYEALLQNGALYIPPPPKDRGGDVHVVATMARAENSTHIDMAECAINLGDEIKAELSGSLDASGSAPVRLKLPTLKLELPDMARAMQSFGPPNLRDRAPWFGDLGLAGRATFEGSLSWELQKPGSLEGKLQFDAATVRLGKTTPCTLSGIDGTLPLSLSWGSSTETTTTKPVAPINGALKIAAIEYAGVTARAQEFKLIAQANQFRIDSPIDVATPVGPINIGAIQISNVFSLPASAAPEIAFTLGAGLDVDKVLRERGVTVNGLSGCVLTGAPMKCRLLSSPGVRGPWELQTSGSLRAPFFGGEMTVDHLSARGLFGPVPVFGGDLLMRGPDGIQVTRFTQNNQQLGAFLTGMPKKNLGTFSIRANAELRDFETTSLSLDGVQHFVLEIESVDFKENEFWYDGELAMTVNYPLVRASFPVFFYKNDEAIREVKFGVRKLALDYELRDGWLYGPRPTKLPDSLIVQAYGSGGGVGALLADKLMSGQIKMDLKGDRDHRIPWPALVRQTQGPQGK
ncbi:MAG TPA: hypothetical protein VGP72_21030 [Planctomycetota bacterium]|jgi:hypothetical protein